MTDRPGKCTQDAEGFVLAGGLSTRMGTDKALIPFAGRPLVEHTLHILKSLGLRASLAGTRSSLDAFAPVVPDHGRGPLDGVCAGLRACSAPWGVFLSVDTPFLPPAVIAYMLQAARVEGSGAVLCTLNGFIQTFPVVLAPALLQALTAELRESHRGCLRAIRSAAHAVQRPVRLLPAEVLAQAGQCEHPLLLPPFVWFLNMNTPADLSVANRLWVNRFA